ncbi:hypothetical protein [Streptomyces sp. C10-9-1]|uniref:hypothetical protein n=1 Tax=Streptomyces sp. C10-9-1 TaxID=1859285 RepID=UPI003D716EBF
MILGFTLIGYGAYLSYNESDAQNTFTRNAAGQLGKISEQVEGLSDGMKELAGGLKQFSTSGVNGLQQSAHAIRSAVSEFLTTHHADVLSAVQTKAEAILKKLDQLPPDGEITDEIKEDLRRLQNIAPSRQSVAPPDGGEVARAQAAAVAAAGAASQFLGNLAKGTLGQIPKLDRGAQYASLGIILLVVAVGVVIFDSVTK